MRQSSDSVRSKVSKRTRMIHDMDDVSTPRKPRSRDSDGLTARQRQVLEIIRFSIKTRGLPPSRTELASELNVAHASGVGSHLQALEKAGFIETLPSIERGIRLLREGAPLYEDVQELVELDAPPARRPALGAKPEPKRVHEFESFADLFEERPDFFLRLPEKAVNVDEYQAGDVVAVARGRAPRKGDVVVGKVGQRIGLRRVSRREDTGFSLIGVVVGAIVPARRGD